MHEKFSEDQIVEMVSNLLQNIISFKMYDWKHISHPEQVKAGSFTFIDPRTGLKIRFDTPSLGAKGFRGKEHFHIYNPYSTGSQDFYLDIHGNPVAKNSKASHIVLNTINNKTPLSEGFSHILIMLPQPDLRIP